MINKTQSLTKKILSKIKNRDVALRDGGGMRKFKRQLFVNYHDLKIDKILKMRRNLKIYNLIRG